MGANEDIINILEPKLEEARTKDIERGKPEGITNLSVKQVEKLRRP